MKENKQLVVLLAIAAAMLLIAIAEMPYGYYQILRIVVCAVGAWTGYRCVRSNIQRVKYFGYAFVIVAIAFNPFVPIEFEREKWLVIDLVCAAYFGFVAWTIKGWGDLKN